MTMDDIMSMANDAGVTKEEFGLGVSWGDLERFAHLVIKHDREQLAKKIEKLPFGDTSQSFAVWVRQDVS